MDDVIAFFVAAGMICGGIIGLIFGLGIIVIAVDAGRFSWTCFLIFWASAAAFFGSLKYALDEDI